MNAKPQSHADTHDIYVSTLLPARRWIASAVAVVMTSLTLAVVSLPIRTVAPNWINGIPVTNLATVVVTPDSAAQKAAALLNHSAIGVATLPADAAARLGAQLAMPYYSFGGQATGATSGKE